MAKFHNEHEPLGGSLFSKTTVICAILALIAAVILAKRMVLGLGSVTNLNNGYPWGIWIVYDVVIGTAFACGGYAMAILCYVLNKGEYHPMVRPALLASAFGYTLGGISIVFDLGRWWNAWHILVPSYWNTGSVMFEVALCVMAYIVVLWIEFSPAILTKFGLKDSKKKLEKILFVFVALGVLLPSMHQSSLGTLLVVMGYQIHPLWQTPILPLLFLASAITMGFSIVVFEALLGSSAFNRSVRHEMPQLAKLARIIQGMMVAYLVIRFGDIVVRGAIAELFTSGIRSLMFWIEIALFATPVVLFAKAENRMSKKALWIGACSLLLAGALYRLDAFLVAYQTGAGWSYFPSVQELLVTIGIIATEILLYVVFVRKFPVFYTHKLTPAELAAAHEK
ncbi:MAG: Ni/Fe-hydrogenase cytochrome b subunit [Alphaproteobacteria bacterium]|nr:Ni/Fe-hydrogenase cytochrome b subunit [Alphaproteobacteria bacterium]